MIRVNREQLLHRLESVQSGLATREIIEQSSCYVFDNGQVITFNDEICCRMPLGLKNLKGKAAVQAAPLLAILRKLTEDEIEINAIGKHFKIKGKRKVAAVRMDDEILLPIDIVDKPKKWQPLHEDFQEALLLVSECAGTDEDEFWTTCVHLNPKFIEACDNYQMSRFSIKTGFSQPIYVRSSSIKHLTNLECTEFCETEHWIHFRNAEGLIFTCRQFAIDDFPDISEFFKTKGSKIILPKGLADAVDKAAIFSAENPDNNHVQIELRKGKLRLKGKGASGYYSEVKRLSYDGPPLQFLITPKLLIELTKRHNECLVTSERLKVDGGKFVYVASLADEEEKDTKEEGNTDEGEE